MGEPVTIVRALRRIFVGGDHVNRYLRSQGYEMPCGGTQRTDDEGRPITCREFLFDGFTLKCYRCGWWRSSHNDTEGEHSG